MVNKISLHKTRCEQLLFRKQIVTAVVLIVIALFASMFVFSVVAQAANVTPIAETGSLLEKLDAIQSEKQKLEEDLANIEQEMSATSEELSLISAQLVLLDQDYAYQSELVDIYKEQVTATRAQLSSAQEAEAEQYETLTGMLRAMEESQKISFWQIIFDSSSVRDMLSRIDMVTSVIEYEKEQLELLGEVRENLAQMRYDLQLLEAEYSESLESLEKSRLAMQKTNQDLQERLDELSAENDSIVYQLAHVVPEVELDETETRWTKALSEDEILAFLTKASEELKAAGIVGNEAECRLGILQAGLSIVGKVPYFWGGRVYTPGWNDSWNTYQTIKHAGSASYPLGESFLYGLDCGGFVFWAALTMYGENSWDSPVEWMAGKTATGIYNGATKINWNEKIPGDLAVNTPLTHIGYYLCTNESGEALYLHCCGGYGVIVSTNSLCSFDRAAALSF